MNRTTPTSAPKAAETVATPPQSPAEATAAAAQEITSPAEQRALAAEVESGTSVVGGIEGMVGQAEAGIDAALGITERPEAVKVGLTYDEAMAQGETGKATVEAMQTALRTIEGSNSSSAILYEKAVKAGTVSLEPVQNFAEWKQAQGFGGLLGDFVALWERVKTDGLGVLFSAFKPENKVDDYGTTAADNLGTEAEADLDVQQAAAANEKKEILAGKEWAAVKVKDSAGKSVDLSKLDQAGRAAFLEQENMSADDLIAFENIVTADLNAEKDSGKPKRIEYLCKMNLKLDTLVLIMTGDNLDKIVSSNTSVYSADKKVEFNIPAGEELLVSYLAGEKSSSDILTDINERKKNKANENAKQAARDFSQALENRQGMPKLAKTKLNDLFNSASAVQKQMMIDVFGNQKAYDENFVEVRAPKMAIPTIILDSSAEGFFGEFGDSLVFRVDDLKKPGNKRTEFFQTLERIQNDLK